MITKGKILSIDLNGNTCQVRMPVFETAGNDEISATATFSNTPGVYNGYKVGDVVFIAFENGTMDTPVVIGKLFLGNLAEEKSPRGTINVETSTIAKKATLPFDSKLDNTITNTPNTAAPFSSLASMAGKVSDLDKTTGQMNIDFGNRFDLKVNKTDGSGEGAETFGWELDADHWALYDQTWTNGPLDKEQSILWADKDGLYIKGVLEAAAGGHIGGFEIADASLHAGNITAFSPAPAPGTTGVYVGPDGIRLGDKFTVDPSGTVTAAGLTINLTPDQEAALKGDPGEPGATGEAGPAGPQGPAGTSVTIKGSYASESALLDDAIAERITPVLGDGYLIDGYLYVYIGPDPKVITGWNNVGKIQGPAGISTTVDLTNDFTTVPCNEFGAVDAEFDWSTVTTQMQVFINGLNDSQDWLFEYHAESGFSTLLNYTMDNTATSTRGTFRLSANAADNIMSADTATITLRATRAGYDVQYITFTISKLKQGTSAKDLSIVAETYVVNEADKQDLTFKITPANLLDTDHIIWTLTGATFDGTYTTQTQLVSDAKTTGVTVPLAYYTDSFSVEAKVQEITTILDTCTITLVTNGSSAINAILTNETEVIPADTDGTVESGFYFTCDVMGYSGTTQVATTLALSNTAEFTVTEIASPGGLTRRIKCTAIGAPLKAADRGTISFTVTVSDTPISKTIIWSKSKTGTSSTSYWLIPSASAISYDGGTVYTPNTLTFTVMSQTGAEAAIPFTTGYYKVFKNESLLASGQSGTINISADKFSSDLTSFKCELFLDDAYTIKLDSESVPMIKDGPQGPQGPAGNGVPRIEVWATETDDDTSPGKVYLDDADLLSITSRGHTLIVFDPIDKHIDSYTTYDTYATPAALDAPLAAVPAGKIILLATYDASSLTDNTRATLKTMGAKNEDTWTSSRISHAFIGMKGLDSGSAYEAIGSGPSGNVKISAFFLPEGIITNGSQANLTFGNICNALDISSTVDENHGIYTTGSDLLLNATAIKTGFLQVGPDTNIKFKANVGANTVQIGGFRVDDKSLYSYSGISSPALGADIILSPTGITASSDNLVGTAPAGTIFALAAGHNFGVETDGTLWASNINITNGTLKMGSYSITDNYGGGSFKASTYDAIVSIALTHYISGKTAVDTVHVSATYVTGGTTNTLYSNYIATPTNYTVDYSPSDYPLLTVNLASLFTPVYGDDGTITVSITISYTPDTISNFSVDTDGQLVAMAATLDGTITASSGSIGPLTITAHGLEVENIIKVTTTKVDASTDPRLPTAGYNLYAASMRTTSLFGGLTYDTDNNYWSEFNGKGVADYTYNDSGTQRTIKRASGLSTYRSDVSNPASLNTRISGRDIAQIPIINVPIANPNNSYSTYGVHYEVCIVGATGTTPVLIGGDNGGIMGNYVTEVVDAFARSGSTIRSVASSITAGVASLTVTGGVSGTTYIIWAILAVGYNTNSI